jgi:hypothetical protein
MPPEMGPSSTAAASPSHGMDTKFSTTYQKIMKSTASNIKLKLMLERTLSASPEQEPQTVTEPLSPTLNFSEKLVRKWKTLLSTVPSMNPKSVVDGDSSPVYLDGLLLTKSILDMAQSTTQDGPLELTSVNWTPP